MKGILSDVQISILLISNSNNCSEGSIVLGGDSCALLPSTLCISIALLSHLLSSFARLSLPLPATSGRSRPQIHSTQLKYSALPFDPDPDLHIKLDNHTHDLHLLGDSLRSYGPTFTRSLKLLVVCMRPKSLLWICLLTVENRRGT